MTHDDDREADADRGVSSEAGYSITYPSCERDVVAVALDGEDQFDVRLYADAGQSRAALEGMLARALTPDEARAVLALLRTLEHRRFDDIADGPLAVLYQRLRDQA